MKHEHAAAGQWKPLVAMVAALIVASGCGGSSKVSSVSSAAATPAPTEVQSTSPSPAQSSYSVNLVLSGGLSGRVTQTQINSSSDCSAGKISVEIIVQGQAWGLAASADGYHGPGRYDVSAFNLMLSSPDYDIWMSTSGGATYASDTSLSVDVGITNLMAGPGEPGAAAHVSGSITCT